MPSCWVADNPTTSSTSGNVQWKFTGAAGYGAGTTFNGKPSGKYAWVDASSPYTGEHFVQLTSPAIDLTGLTSPSIQFDWFKNHAIDTSGTPNTSYTDNLFNVEVSNDGGTTWTSIFSDLSNANYWRTEVISLAASYANTTINVRFTVDKDLGASGGYDDLLLDNFKVKETPTCFIPSNLAVGNVTTTTAELSWIPPMAVPSLGYDLYYSSTSTAPTATTTPSETGIGVGVNTYVATGLMPATTYYVWIRSRCSSTDQSDWVGGSAFTTGCVTFNVPYFTNFDAQPSGSSSSPNAPTCWSYLEDSGFSGYGYTTTSTGAASAPNWFYMTNTGATSGNSMLATPVTNNIASGTNRVRFFARSSGNGYLLEVGTLADAADPATFTIIGSPISLTTTMTEYIVDIPAGTDEAVAFKHGLGGTYRLLYLDDIYVEAIPSCVKPSAVTTANVTSSGVDISWTAPTTAPANGYEVYYSTTNTAPDASTVLDATNSATSATTSATLSGLTAGTMYYVWVRSVCSTTDQSYWQPGGSFTTFCNAASIPMIEGFESGYAHDELVSVANGCWTQTSIGGTSSWTVNSTNTNYNRTPRTGSYNATLRYGNEDWMVKTVNLTAGTVYQFELYARQDNSNATYADITLGYGSTADTSAFTTIVGPTSIVNGDYQKVFGTFTVPTTGAYFVGIKGRINGTPWYISIDDIKLDVAPTCPEPTALVSTAASTTSVDLSWTAPATAPSGYDIYYSTSNVAPDASTVLDATNSATSTMTSATLGGLTASTTYYVWVRSNCSASDQSPWTGPLMVYTGVCQPTGGTSSMNYYLSTVTSTGGTTDINYSASSYAAYVDNSSMTFSGSEGVPIDVNLVASSGTNYFYTWVDWNNDLDFDDAGETIIATTSYTSSAMATINIPTGQATGNYRVRFGQSWSGALSPCGPAPYGSYVDYTLTVLPPPSCMQPGNVSPTGATTTTADLSWTAPATAPANGYEVYYSTSNTAPDANTVLDATNSTTSTTTTATISGLTASTSYYVWVRSNCSTTDKSNWVGPTTVYTGVCQPTGGSSSSQYYLSGITSNGGVTNINYSASTYAAYVDNSAMTFSGSEGVPIDVNLVASAGTNYFFTWVDWNNDLDFDDAGETIIATASALATINIPSGQATGDYRVRFAQSWSGALTPCGPAPYGGYVDYTLSVLPPASCIPPTGLAATTTTTDGTVTWMASSSAPNNYDVYVDTANTAPTSTSMPTYPAVTGTSQVIPGTSGTTYYVWVRSVCSSTDQSTWAGPISYTIPYPTPANDDCANATSITGISSGNPYTNAQMDGGAATNNGGFVSTCGGMNDGVWYTVVGDGGDITITVTPTTSWDPEIGVYTGSCGTFTCQGNKDSGGSGGTETYTFTSVLGTTYYINVGQYSGSTDNPEGPFNIEVATTAVLGTSEVIRDAKDVKIYPNPFTDVINIADVKDLKSISVIDMSGRVVRSIENPDSRINLAELQSGMYVLTLQYEDGTVKSVKVIKK